MIKEKMIQYKKAYTELNEIFQILSSEQKDKIPLVFINNVKNNMDTNYEFKYDISKEIFEQNLMIETKALLIEIYEKYLAPIEEKELWNKYDQICLSKIEQNKREKYNINIFEDSKVNENKVDNISVLKNNKVNVDANKKVEETNNNFTFLPLKYVEKETVFKKVFTKIKNFINKITKK